MSPLPPLRVPTADGAILAVPPLDEADRSLARNRELLASLSRPLLDRSWPEIRSLARRELLSAALLYSQRRDPPPSDAPLLLAGHQPELFHPGVWFKNFALAGLARRFRATAVNLIIDSDTVKASGIHLPLRTESGPRLQFLSFDRAVAEVPWEEYRRHDPARFAAFADEVESRLRDWGIEPLLPRFWRSVESELSHRDNRVGESFAAARRTLEHSWGCDNLEVPLSHLCRGEAFAYLVGALLADLPRFVACYNTIVHDHRRRHHIRSLHHPVPDLAVEGDWLELPLWGWTHDRPRRARLFARLHGDQLDLRAGNTLWPSLPAPTRTPARFIAAWHRLEAAGYKPRSRALLTTTFARILLGDLFLHGIGGGKYDELTDALLSRFWEIPPPSFLVLSATCLLPLPAYPATVAQHRHLARTLRDLHYNPQRHLDAADSSDLARQKQQWIARIPTTRAERRERFHQIRRLSDALRPQVSSQLAQTHTRLEQIDHELAANAVLRRRDYAFCLFPESQLRSFFTRFL